MGQFGFYSLCHEDDLAARIVQIGWAVGRNSAEQPTVKEYVIRPNGFRIARKAEVYHGITNDHACEKGRELRDVLEEFFDDMYTLHNSGGRIVAHHLESSA